MIEENGRSRVYLGVHWLFDAFVINAANAPDLACMDSDGKFFGGVPLGLQIAEDIFQAGAGKAPKKSAIGSVRQSDHAARRHYCPPTTANPCGPY